MLGGSSSSSWRPPHAGEEKSPDNSHPVRHTSEQACTGIFQSPNHCSQPHVQQRGAFSAESYPDDRVVSQINDPCCFKPLSYGVVCYTAADNESSL